MKVEELIYCPLQCGTRLTPSALLEHFKYHNAIFPKESTDFRLYQIHRPFESLIYFAFNLLKQRGIIDKYTRWKDWLVLYSKIDWARDWWVYEQWQRAIESTCYNQPCISCNKTRIDRIMKYRQMKKEFHSKGFRTTKTGMKIPLATS